MNKNMAPRVAEALRRDWEPVYRSRLHYLVSWGTRGRRSVLKERHARRLRESIPRFCEERGIHLLEVAVGLDHVHVLFGLRPSQSVSSVVREVKGRSGMELMSEFPELRVWLGGNLLWDERYSVETVSAARLERIVERLRSVHEPVEPIARAS